MRRSNARPAWVASSLASMVPSLSGLATLKRFSTRAVELLPAQTALKLVDRKRTISVLIEPVEESRRRGLDLREIKRPVVVGIEAPDGALGPCRARLGPRRSRRQGSSRDCEESTSTA